MSADILNIRVTDVGTSMYVALSGELDLYTFSELNPLFSRVKGGGISDIDLDLTQLRYIDSTGLMQVVRLYRLSRSRFVSLTVHVRTGSIVERVLRLIGAGDLFPIVSTADGAEVTSPAPPATDDNPSS